MSEEEDVWWECAHGAARVSGHQDRLPVGNTAGVTPNVFGATEFPNQPITEGAMLGAGSPPMQAIDEDANMLLAAMYQVMPNSIISELINQGSE